MQGLAEAIKYLYQQFILRDVVAYVSPGAILAASVLEVYLGTVAKAVAFARGIPAAAYLPLYGVLFITGLAMENLGEFIGVIRFHNRGQDLESKNSVAALEVVLIEGTWLERRKARQRLNDRRHFQILQEFHDVTSPLGDANTDGYGAWLERTRERITVKKYASGNFAVAMLISMILIFVTKIRPNLRLLAIGLVGLILILSWLRAHWYQLNLQVIWEDEALKPYEQHKTGSAQPPVGQNLGDQQDE